MIDLSASLRLSSKKLIAGLFLLICAAPLAQICLAAAEPIVDTLALLAIAAEVKAKVNF